MEELIYNSDIVTCSYYTELHMVALEWKKNTHSAEYRKLFSTLLEYSTKHKIRRVLSDLRREGLVTVEDARWLTNKIHSLARKEKLERLALVAEDTIFADAYTSMLSNKLDGSDIQIQVFQDYAQARSWLLSDQIQLT